MKKALILTSIAIVALSLAGCSKPKEDPTLWQHKKRPEVTMHHVTISSEFDFLSQMIPHHQEAIDTSTLVLADTNNEELKMLTTNIISGQTQEITLMKSWLDQRYSGKELPNNYMNMMPSLTGSTGLWRDNLYIKGMLEHHKGAIDMAQQALKLELHPEVKALAENIIRVQTTEMDTLYALPKYAQ